MVSEIFVNLAVKDLGRSTEFFKSLDFTFNPQFTNESAACMILGENMFAMLIVESFFRTFTTKEMIDTSRYTEALTALRVESKAKVNEMADKAIQNGATANKEAQDHGWMFSRSFHDLDGHTWEVFYMDPGQMPSSTQ